MPSKEEERKITIINNALDKKPPDRDTLRHFAINGGLINNALRRRAWPILLDVDINPYIDLRKEISTDHKDLDQVAKDIDRSMWKFTEGKPHLRQTKRQELTRIINAILTRHPELHYYQGFHDICSIFLLVAGEEGAFAMMEKLSLFHIRDALDPDLESTKELLSLLFPLIKFEDKQLYDYLIASGVQPFFALSWVLTWFSHGFDDLDIIARLFDVFIATHPLMPLYVGVEIIVHFREKLLHEVECEYSAVHSFLCKINQDLPFETIIDKSMRLFERLPPKKLQRLAPMSNKSILFRSYPLQWIIPKSFGFKALFPKRISFSGWFRRDDGRVNVEKVVFYVLFSSLAAFSAVVFYNIRQK